MMIYTAMAVSILNIIMGFYAFVFQHDPTGLIGIVVGGLMLGAVLKLRTK